MIDIQSLPAIPAVLRGSIVKQNTVYVHVLRNLFDAMLMDLEKSDVAHDPSAMMIPVCRFTSLLGLDPGQYIPASSPAYEKTNGFVLFNNGPNLDVHILVKHLQERRSEWSFVYFNQYNQRIQVYIAFVTTHVHRTGPLSVTASCTGPENAVRRYTFGFELKEGLERHPVIESMSGQQYGRASLVLDPESVTPSDSLNMTMVVRPVLYDPTIENVYDTLSAVDFAEGDEELYSIHFRAFAVLPNLNISTVVALPQAEAVTEVDAEKYNEHFDVLRIRPTLPLSSTDQHIVLYENALQTSKYLFDNVLDVSLHPPSSSELRTDVVMKDHKLSIVPTKDMRIDSPRDMTITFKDGSNIHVFLYTVYVTPHYRQGSLSATTYVSKLERGMYPLHKEVVQSLRVHQEVVHPITIRTRQRVLHEKDAPSTESRVRVGNRQAPITLQALLASQNPHSEGYVYVIPHLRHVRQTLDL